MPLLICFLAIFVQQAMVAATTVAIALAAAAVTGGSDPTAPLLFFCALLLSASLPEILIECEKERSKYWLFSKAVGRAVRENRGATAAYFNRSVRGEKEPFVDTELWLVVSDNVLYAADAFTTLLNILLNTIAVAGLLDASFVLAFSASAGVSVAGAALSFRLIRARTEAAQDSRASMFSMLRMAIPNVWIGNAVNCREWGSAFSGRLHRSERDQLGLAFSRSGLSSAATIAGSLPYLIAVSSYALANLGNLPALSALVAMLPRQVSILQNMGVIVAYATQLSERVARTRLVMGNLMLNESERGAGGAIDWEKMRVCRDGEASEAARLLDPSDVDGAFCGFAPGRYTLRGTNGCGKSSLLARIKEGFADRAYLLPSNPVLYFSEFEGREASSGQAVDRVLRLIEGGGAGENVEVFLLDEWDANLDSEKRAEHDARIAELAKKKCVIEVRHNGGGGGSALVSVLQDAETESNSRECTIDSRSAE